MAARRTFEGAGRGLGMKNDRRKSRIRVHKLDFGDKVYTRAPHDVALSLLSAVEYLWETGCVPYSLSVNSHGIINGIEYEEKLR
jgi:hypothetical protein